MGEEDGQAREGLLDKGEVSTQKAGESWNQGGKMVLYCTGSTVKRKDS